MQRLLDEVFLSGAHTVATRLRPTRIAHLTDRTDADAVFKRIAQLCQCYGGAGQPLIPHSGGIIPPGYFDLLPAAEIDGVAVPEDVQVILPRRVGRQRNWDVPFLSVAAAIGRHEWARVSVTELAADDPWRLIYAAVLGFWPTTPDSVIHQGLAPDVRFEDVLPVERVTATGSLADLISRTQADGHDPRTASCIELASGAAPDTSYMGPDGIFPSANATRRGAGPNIVVACSPDDVDDIALLWNLRGAHGGPQAMPIGVPASHLSMSSFATLMEPGNRALFGLAGGDIHLTSASIPLGDLARIADEFPAKVTPWQDLLMFGPAPGRTREHTVTWRDGHAEVPALTDADIEVFRYAREGFHGTDFVLDVEVKKHPLPRDATLRGSWATPRFQAGSAQRPVSLRRVDRTVEVRWPSRWTALEAVSATRRLTPEASDAGRSCMALLAALGGLEGVDWLLDEDLLLLLTRSSERSGMGWWRKRWRDLQADLRGSGDCAAQRLEDIAVRHGRDEQAVAPADEGRDLAFSEFAAVLGKAAAMQWITWAENRHLVVRGARLRCPDCGNKWWLPFGSLGSRISCTGCGRFVKQPFSPQKIDFTYRLGEVLRRVLLNDALSHILTARYMARIFRNSDLIGVHPGVTFRDVSGRDLGEADVLLLFGDGALVPVEVKTTGAGIDASAIDLLARLAYALEAPWSAFATPQSHAEVSAPEHLLRALPDEPRFLLTRERIFEQYPVWVVGRHPFHADPEAQHDQIARRTGFRKMLADGLAHSGPEVPLRDLLLNDDWNLD